MKFKKPILILITFLSLGFTFYSMKGFITPYVNFKEAMTSGKFSQVMGFLDKNSISYDSGNQLIFTLVEKNSEDDIKKLQVIYNKSVPVNFSHSEKVVALGRYNQNKKLFMAEKLLLKCPSKYKAEKSPGKN